MCANYSAVLEVGHQHLASTFLSIAALCSLGIGVEFCTFVDHKRQRVFKHFFRMATPVIIQEEVPSLLLPHMHGKLQMPHVREWLLDKSFVLKLCYWLFCCENHNSMSNCTMTGVFAACEFYCVDKSGTNSYFLASTVFNATKHFEVNLLWFRGLLSDVDSRIS